MQHLQPNTTLQGGKYRIEHVLGQGGFGITYLAEQVALHRFVAIKEFFMKENCQRDEDSKSMTVPSDGGRMIVDGALHKFRQEALKLASISHPNIVRVIDVFDENDTAYYVMDYIPGGSLSDYVKKNGPMSEEYAMGYIRQIAGALKYMHTEKHMCHFDVKPSNIMLDGQGHAFLIDFGISKNYGVDGHATSSMPVGISAGFAPIEQYGYDVLEFSPESDVYSLGATLYYLLSGNTPAPSVARASGQELKPVNGMSDYIKGIITKSMNISRKSRPSSMDVFMQPNNHQIYSSDEETIWIDGRKNDDEEKKGDTEVVLDEEDGGKRHGKALLIVSLLAIVAAVVLVLIVLFGRGNGEQTNSSQNSSSFIEKKQSWDDMHNRKGFDDSEERTYESSDFNESIHEKDVALSAEENESFINLVHLWDEFYNRKEFDPSGENCPYADIVKLYGKTMSGLEAAETVHKLLMLKPDFWQKSTNIKVTKITDKRVRCDFEKHTSVNGKKNVYPAYLVLIDEYEGIWRIEEESDFVTDANLKKSSIKQKSLNP